MAGRSAKINEAMIDEAVKYLKAGNYVNTICLKIGIDNSTWYNWLKRGIKARKGSIFHRFYVRIKEAEAEAEIKAVAIIQEAMKNDWRCAVVYLERKHPSRWGRSTGIPHGDPSDPLTIHIVPSKRKKKPDREKESK